MFIKKRETSVIKNMFRILLLFLIGTWLLITLHMTALAQPKEILLDGEEYSTNKFASAENRNHNRINLDENTRELFENPYPVITPKWVEESVNYELPEWFDSVRVQAHTRLRIVRWSDKPIFLSVAKKMQSMGIRVFSRHFKTANEQAGWPITSENDSATVSEKHNCLKKFIDNAHAVGCRIIGYYWHMSDSQIANEHPEWLSRNSNDILINTARGRQLCFNSPASDYILNKILKLVSMGVDGLYFDSNHQSQTGCFCKYCRKKFKEETGLDAPARENITDPIYLRYLDFKNATIEQTFLKWRRAIHLQNSKCVMIVSSNTYPQLQERQMSHRLLRIMDSHKTEFNFPILGDFAVENPSTSLFTINKEKMRLPEPDVRLALGYTLARDGADGRPPHIWIPGLVNEASAIFATAGIITHGGIANLDMVEDRIPDADLFKKAIDMGNLVSPAFAGTKPLRWALVHYPESARNIYFPDLTSMWVNSLYPFFGAYKTFLRKGVPVGVITDSQLEQGLLNDSKILFLPSPQHLSGRMKLAIDTFKEHGGMVIEQRADWKWHDSTEHQKAMEALWREVSEKESEAPVQIVGGPEKMHAVAFKTRNSKRVTVSLCNDFSWIFTGTVAHLNEEELEKMRNAPPPTSCTDVKLVLRGFGIPKKVTNLVTGESINFAISENTIEINVPDFNAMSVLVAEFDR